MTVEQEAMIKAVVDNMTFDMFLDTLMEKVPPEFRPLVEKYKPKIKEYYEIYKALPGRIKELETELAAQKKLIAEILG